MKGNAEPNNGTKVAADASNESERQPKMDSTMHSEASFHATSEMNSMMTTDPKADRTSGRGITRAATRRLAFMLLAPTVLAGAACGKEDSAAAGEAAGAAADGAAARVSGTVRRVADTSYTAATIVSGVAEPMQHATLSTKLMGTVTAVSVREGESVRAGQALLQIDARELSAKRAQVAASIADAEATQQDASVQAARFRALYADSAATRAQYDAAATGLARATAAVAAARAGASEVEAMSSYATVRAPFSGVVSSRMVDVGAFAAPGAPLLTIDDESSLRVRVTVAADIANALTRGQRLSVTVDGARVDGRVEGIVAGGAGNLFVVNVIVPNTSKPNVAAHLRSGSAASVAIPGAQRKGLLVPASALVHEGDLTGVIVRGSTRDERRWVRVGEAVGGLVEITSGLRAGEEIVVPNDPSPAVKPGA